MYLEMFIKNQIRSEKEVLWKRGNHINEFTRLGVIIYFFGDDKRSPNLKDIPLTISFRDLHSFFQSIL